MTYTEPYKLSSESSTFWHCGSQTLISLTVMSDNSAQYIVAAWRDVCQCPCRAGIQSPVYLYKAADYPMSLTKPGWESIMCSQPGVYCCHLMTNMMQSLCLAAQYSHQQTFIITIKQVPHYHQLGMKNLQVASKFTLK